MRVRSYVSNWTLFTPVIEILASLPPPTYVDEDRKPAFFSYIFLQPKIIHPTNNRVKLGENSNYKYSSVKQFSKKSRKKTFTKVKYQFSNRI